MNQFDLQGVGIWALGYDGDRTELWAALEEKFTSTIDIGDEFIQPTSIYLYPAYPNPFNAITTIKYSVKTQPRNTLDPQHATSLRVYDLKGRLVETLIHERLKRGNHEIHWNASNYSTGIYFVSLSSGTEKVIQKISFIK